MEDKAHLAKQEALEDHEKAAHLEWELPHKAMEDFWNNTAFGDAAEDFLTTKLMDLYEVLTTQIKGVNPDFLLDKVKALSSFLQWKKGQEAHPPCEKASLPQAVPMNILTTRPMPSHRNDFLVFSCVL